MTSLFLFRRVTSKRGLDFFGIFDIISLRNQGGNKYETRYLP